MTASPDAQSIVAAVTALQAERDAFLALLSAVADGEMQPDEIRSRISDSGPELPAILRNVAAALSREDVWVPAVDAIVVSRDQAPRRADDRDSGHVLDDLIAALLAQAAGR